MSLTIARQTLDRINNRESLMHGTALASMAHDMQELSNADHALEQAHAERRMNDVLAAYGYGPPSSARDKPFLYVDGVAIIPCHGTLINRFSYSWGFVTGYNFLRAQYNAALDDDDVTLIVFDINSNGGEATGCFELCQDIFEGRERKPSLAVVDSNGNSAAYMIGSACTRMVCTPSGWVGSIGVISQHVDVSEAMKQMGVKITIIAEDVHKADGNPYEPLPDDVRADIKAAVTKRYGEFVEVVARNRGLDSQAIRDTQSRCFRADDALALGLIDAVQSPTVAVNEFLGELGSDEPADEEDDQDMATAEKPAASEAATAEALAGAQTAERARIKGIQTCEEAKDREGLAAHLALSTSMSVEDAKGILAASPKTVSTAAAAPPPVAEPKAEGDPKPADQANAFQAAMDAGKHPNVGGDDGKEGDGTGGDEPKLSRAARAAEMAFGGKPRERADTHH